MNEKPVLAVFDFDNTLTNCDSLLVFLRHTQGLSHVIFVWLTLAWDCMLFFLKKRSRQEIKEKMLRKFLRGMSDQKLNKQGIDFSRHILDHYLKPEGIERVNWHKNQGHRLILISASLDFYLADWAKRHGFDHLICSKLALDEENRVTGKLVGKNCWGPEKARRLKEWTNHTPYSKLYVYGDSAGDADILAMADYPFYRTFQSTKDEDEKNKFNAKTQTRL